MIITGNFRLDVEADEKIVFKVMKQFFSEQFQNYKLEVSGRNETLKDEFSRKEELKMEDKFEGLPQPKPINKIQTALG